VLRLYTATGAAGRAAFRRIRQDLRTAAPEARLASRTVRDAEWRHAWKTHARPVTIGRLAVVPAWWRRSTAPDRVVVRLDPGMAFGSGEHQTTQLCLAAIEQHLRVGSTVIDVGTGSGILAIAAAKLGADRVVAIDNDPVAVKVASANAKANGVGRRVAVRLAGDLGRTRLRADLIVANLTGQVLPGILRGAARRLKPGGWFVGSGFGAAGVRDVVREISLVGLRVVRVTSLRGWRAAHAVAPGARSGGPAGRRSE
jgi:ribosomal protein L11 methyltransferase